MVLLVLLGLLGCGIEDVAPILKKSPYIVKTYRRDEECLLVCDEHSDLCLSSAGDEIEKYPECEKAKEECYESCPLVD